MARILVTDAAWASAVACIRSLGRAGHHVVASETTSLASGCHSRYARTSHRYPAPLVSGDAMVDSLLEIVGREQIDLVFPVTEDVVVPLLRHRARVEAQAKLALPPSDALEVALDKEATRALAAGLGIATPRSVVAHSAAEAAECGRELGWPVVLKPRTSRSIDATTGSVTHRSVTYANDPASLDTAFARLAEPGGVLLQEYCPGVGHGVELLLRDGVPLAVFQHRRIRELPFTGGASAFRESASPDVRMVDDAIRLLAALGWTGLAMVEYKAGPNGPVLMEINGRPWGSLPLAVQSGVDFPALAAAVYLDDPAPVGTELPRYRTGVRSRNLQLELTWIASVLRRHRTHAFLPTPTRGEALRALARLPWPRDGYDVQSLHDPVPGVVDLASVTRKLLDKAGNGG